MTINDLIKSVAKLFLGMWVFSLLSLGAIGICYGAYRIIMWIIDYPKSFELIAIVLLTLIIGMGAITLFYKLGDLISGEMYKGVK